MFEMFIKDGERVTIVLYVGEMEGAWKLDIWNKGDYTNAMIEE